MTEEADDYGHYVNWREHISVSPDVCHGKACVRGTRVMVSVVLANLTAGYSAEEITRSYPRVGSADVRAVIAYAADFARGRAGALPLEGEDFDDDDAEWREYRFAPERD